MKDSAQKLKDSEQQFKDWLRVRMPGMCREYGEFDGNVRVLEDCDKDLVCRNFLYYFPSWIDDIVPPCTIDKARYIDAVYSECEECFLDEIRGDVYLYLESKLDELMREVWAEYSNAKPEPFAGYEVGQ
jgi:hypothetical protein